MKTYKFISVLASIMVAAMACSKNNPAPNLEVAAPDKVITFDKHIKPLFADRCAPCHLAGGDRVNKYDDYKTVSTLITGIVGRIIKQPTDALFMPKNGRKLTESEMLLINRWIADGQLEK